MSEQELTTTTARREQVRVRIERFRQSRQRSLLGLPEIIGLAGSALFLLLVLFAYFYSLAPARTRLETLNVERDRLQRQQRTLAEGLNLKADTQTTVENINKSIEYFENNRLNNRSEGRLTLYTELNQLIRRNGLRNTAGPNYVALEALSTEQREGQAQQPKLGKDRLQNIFPGIGVNVTVEGQYQNLRHFVRDIELSRQFIVINAIQLESTKDTEAASAPAPAPELPGMPSTAGPTMPRGALVSLHLDLAAYFRRGAGDALPDSANETH